MLWACLPGGHDFPLPSSLPYRRGISPPPTKKLLTEAVWLLLTGRLPIFVLWNPEVLLSLFDSNFRSAGHREAGSNPWLYPEVSAVD